MSISTLKLGTKRSVPNQAVWKVSWRVPARAVELILREVSYVKKVGSTKVRPADIRPAEIGPIKIDLAKTGLVETGPVKTSLAEIGPIKIGLAEIGPSEISSAKMGINKYYFTKVCLSKLGADQPSSLKITSAEIGLANICAAEVSIFQVRACKVNSAQVRLRNTNSSQRMTVEVQKFKRRNFPAVTRPWVCCKVPHTLNTLFSSRIRLFLSYGLLVCPLPAFFGSLLSFGGPCEALEFPVFRFFEYTPNTKNNCSCRRKLNCKTNERNVVESIEKPARAILKRH